MAVKIHTLLAQTIYLVITALNIVHNAEALDANGANVCQKTVSFTQFYKQSYQYSRKVTYKTKCGFLGWGRCTRYKTVYGVRYRDATRQAYKKAYECCKGWRQVGNQCPQAICSQGCVHGTCTQPNYCACSTGHYGKLCNRDCPPHKWGAHCVNDCLCKNNAKCSPHTGDCSCTPGWEGKYCDKPCGQGYYGNKCLSVCQCQNGTHCDAIGGNCTCAKGYHGERCEMPCSAGSYGQNCALKCACPLNAVCDHVNGTCNCPSGWMGNRQCASHRSLCDSHHCMHGSSCDHVTGMCNCSSGWTGEICNQKCPQSTYGYRCAHKCLNCMNGAACDHVTGTCVCMPGYYGERCQYYCQEGTYGIKCAKKCACQNNATCSHIDGFCNCTSGFTGVHCENHCTSEDGGITQGCEDETEYDETFQGKTNNLLPIVLGGLLSFVIVAVIAMGCFIRYKRSKRMSGRDETTDNASPHVTEYTEISLTTSGNEERIYQTPSSLPLAAPPGNPVEAIRHYAESTSPAAAPTTHVYATPTLRPQCTAVCSDVNVARATNEPASSSAALKNHVYDRPKVNPQCTAACDDVNVAKATKYMELQQPVRLNIYEPMSPVTRRNLGFPEEDDREGMSSNEYEDLQLRNENDYEPLCASTSHLPQKEQPN